MCAGSDMPALRSSDGPGIGLIAPLRRSGRDGDDRRTARASRAPDRPRADVPAGVARAGRGARRGRPRRREPARVHARRGSCGRRRPSPSCRRTSARSAPSSTRRSPRTHGSRRSRHGRPSTPASGGHGIPPNVSRDLRRDADRRRARGSARPARRARAPREGPVRRRGGARATPMLARFVRALPRARARVQGDGRPPPRRAWKRRARLPQPPGGGRLRG